MRRRARLSRQRRQAILFGCDGGGGSLPHRRRRIGHHRGRPAAMPSACPITSGLITTAEHVRSNSMAMFEARHRRCPAGLRLLACLLAAARRPGAGRRNSTSWRASGTGPRKPPSPSTPPWAPGGRYRHPGRRPRLRCRLLYLCRELAAGRDPLDPRRGGGRQPAHPARHEPADVPAGRPGHQQPVGGRRDDAPSCGSTMSGPMPMRPRRSRPMPIPATASPAR